MTDPSRARTLIRKLAGAHRACPIEVVPGRQEPILVGESFHWENKSGDIIRHPNAYARAWGKPIYIGSTLRVVVGDLWIRDMACGFSEFKLVPRSSKVKTRFERLIREDSAA